MIETDPLSNYRTKIDEIDDQIVELLGQRFDLILKIKNKKRKLNIAVYDQSREEKILKRVIKKGTALGLNPILLQALFIQIFTVSKRNQV
ncbi:MAG: hypothetical protein UT36_C0008G0044 [Candidatus Peregrinibacteria bacterium GW2011_GWF2_39_17]|nr:MAG: hypothetical protein UT36_C0008G0044 [Candidatus Peregrinibacteria bacterium GW2011_GWF2_39_17]HCW32083.1 hypothetical protein [Candidatus Peregrinibacteria bacterium]